MKLGQYNSRGDISGSFNRPFHVKAKLSAPQSIANSTVDTPVKVLLDTVEWDLNGNLWLPSINGFIVPVDTVSLLLRFTMFVEFDKNSTGGRGIDLTVGTGLSVHSPIHMFTPTNAIEARLSVDLTFFDSLVKSGALVNLHVWQGSGAPLNLNKASMSMVVYP